MITREFNLYLHAGHSIPLVINVNQYDRGETWVFTLFNSDGTQYIPSSGAIVGIKSDNLGIINAGEVDGLGRVLIDETEQMTAAVGKAVFELLIDDQTHGTANFVVLVEPKPGDNADLSESDYSLFQQAIDGTSAAAIAEGVADWMDENLTPTSPVVDASLTVQGAAADSAKVGQELSDLKSQIANGVPYAVKVALNHILQNVAFKNDTDYSADKATINAWANNVSVVSITAVYTQSGNIYEYDSLEALKADLVVTANYDNETSAEVSAYALSGVLSEGTSIITVTYESKTTTFNVTVSSTTKAVWDYTLGRMPSSADGIETVLNGSGTATFESDGIHAAGVGTGATDYARFIPTALSTGTNLIAEHEFIISSLGNTSANINALLSNGTDGCNVILTNNADLCYYKGTTRTKITSFELNTLYKLRIEYESGLQAKIYLDDELIFTQTNANKSTYYTTMSRLQVQNKATVIIKSMKWYARGE